MHVKRRANVLAVCVLVLLALLAGAAPASAAPAGETACAGALLNAMVKGDLVVPVEATCDLSGTTVYGNVRLEPGARLYADYSEIKGAIRVGGQMGTLQLSYSRVGGGIEIRGIWGVLVTSTINGNIRVEDAVGLTLNDVTVSGEVQVARSRHFTDTKSGLKGAVTVQDVGFTAFRGSHLGKDVTVERAREEVRLCESSVAGNATFVGNATKVSIGGGVFLCGGNEVRGDLAVHQNLGTITVANNAVRGDLACTGNEPAPVGGNNQVERNKEGQCSGL